MKKISTIFLAAGFLALILSGCYPSGASSAHTPIPTLIPATLPAAAASKSEQQVQQGQCKIAALDLIGAWVQAGKPESDTFDFKSVDGKDCQGAFQADVLPLFTQPNVWYGGALACSACHNPDLKNAAAQMDLSSLNGILAGSRRSDANAQGQDILAGDWTKSKLYIMLSTRQMPIGRPPDSPPKGPDVMAGKAK